VRSHRFHIVLAASLGAVALAAGAVSTAPAASPWSRISGPAQPGSQLGLARTQDGVLHVIWNRGATPTSIFETRLSAAGTPAGTSTVATGWNGNGGLALLVMPDKTLRLFASGTGGINTFTAPAGGRNWSLQRGIFWGTAIAEAAGVIGATLTKDGQPVTAWSGNAAEGVLPASVPQSGYQGGMTESHLATDAASGAVVLEGETNSGQGGVYVQQILPSRGAHVLLPPIWKDFGDGVSGRIGAPGVYVAYADGTAVRLYRYGGASKTRYEVTCYERPAARRKPTPSISTWTGFWRHSGKPGSWKSSISMAAYMFSSRRQQAFAITSPARGTLPCARTNPAASYCDGSPIARCRIR